MTGVMRSVMVAIGVAALSAGCGGSGGGKTAATAPARNASADRRPPLPRGWRRVVNLRSGFNLGIPPGWTGRGVRGATLVRSRDRGLAVSIAADYGQQGQALAPARYAAATLRALRGYRRLRLGSPRPVRGARFPAAAVTATGVYAPTGVRQAIRAIALQRRGVVTFSLLVFRNVRVAERVYRRALDEMVRTFRAQPAGP